ncbi:unnamed protein product [Bursaphelenchus okinawaensis]|uniref:Uncharacterized protein n=1 Tax=Bursaphelenchus okinawaensis TaxID=465554 RepID=A0A811LND0_9BILA|nr:unnamed protein product [Bursaphelenchus okinawaensis]CAG9125938.1 unnamed protein product [Bursaphelenchus okinawaensis]
MLGQELSVMVSRAVSKPIDIAGSIRREPVDCFEYTNSTTSTARPVEAKQKPVIRVRPQIKKTETPKSNPISLAMNKSHNEVNKENVSYANKMPLIYNLYANPSPSTATPSPLRLKYGSECSCGAFDCLAAASHNHSVCWDVDDENEQLDSFTSLPAGFRSVGDIIGYANVVRAQRQEALGKLDMALLNLNNMRLTRQSSTKK